MAKQKQTAIKEPSKLEKNPVDRLIHLLFFILLLLSISFRLIYLPTLYKLDDGDTARDYLIARHIVKYRQYPAIGPNNAVYESVRASPLYYYLLSIPIFIHDSPYSIGVFNILLQAASMICIYALAFTLFGTATATLCAILLLFNQELFSQSFYMIQAHFGHVFFNGSYLFLALAYLRRSLKSIYVSIILFALGCTVAFHGFPALIGYLLTVLFVCKSCKFTIKQMLYGFLTMAVIGVTFYAPMLIRLATSGNTLFLIKEPVYITSFTNFPLRTLANVRLAMDDWVRALWLSSTIKNIVLGVLATTFVYHLGSNKQQKSRFSLVICLYVLQIAFFAALLHIETNSYQYDAATGLMLIALSYAATSLWPKTLLGNIVRWIMIISLILFVIPTQGYIQWQQSQMGQELSLQNRIQPIYDYLDTQKTQDPLWYRHFQVAMYSGRIDMYRWKDSMIWNLLEHHYDRPFIRVTNDGYNFATISSDNTKFILICEEYASVKDAQNRCIPPFIQDQEGRPYTTQVISDKSPRGYIVFLATIKNR